MSQHRPVPRLDLAPKLRRPLSLWNPLDYLRLLYWIFLFPQALRKYVHVYSGLIPNEDQSQQNVWKIWPNITLTQLVLQGVVLAVIAPLIQGIFLNKLGFLLDYNAILANSILIIFASTLFIYIIVIYITEYKPLYITEYRNLSKKNITKLAIALGVGLGV